MRRRTVILPLFIPFAGCPHRCVYCRQDAISGGEGREVDVTADLERMLSARPPGAPPADEAAFYGGSFTSLPREEQERLLSAAAPFLASRRIRGLRVSARPDAVGAEALCLLREGGVTTVELGVQSLDDGVLSLSGRGHGALAARQAAARVREGGFRLGLQMMTGLPGDTRRSALDTARGLADLRPDFVRIYPTLVIEGTPLAGMWRRGEFQPWDLEETLDVLSLILPLFASRAVAVARVGLLVGTDGALDPRRVLAGPLHHALGDAARRRAARRRLAAQDTAGGRPPRTNPRDLHLFPETAGGQPEADPGVPRGWFLEGNR